MAMTIKLRSGLQATYASLNIPRVARRIVIVLLMIHTVLLGYSACVHSPTLNEPGHLAAGLSHWKFGRFELYRVNPPLVRMVAAVPVIAVGYRENWRGFYDDLGARPEMGMGEDFVAANGERTYFLFMIARWACIPFSWLGAAVCYLWARDLYGHPAGVIACGIWCFEPNILTHAALITPDAAATALGLTACYTFWQWLRNPTWQQAVFTGVVLGLAELAKTTLILFYPLWPVLWFFYRWPDRHRMTFHAWGTEAGMLVLRLAVGVYVLNLGYGFEGTCRQLKTFDFVSDLFTQPSTVSTFSDDVFSVETAVEIASQSGVQSKVSGALDFVPRANRFVDTWFGELPMPFPKNYILGLDIQQRDFEDYGRPSYLCGQWRDRGWWYYYLYAAAVKVPLGILLLGLGIVPARLLGWLPPTFRRDEIVLLAAPILTLAVASYKSGFTEHLRYVLPAFPFAFVWVSQAVRVFANPKCLRLSWLVAGLLLWAAGSSFYVYPHSLSYFNELGGGPQGGSRHLIHSNIDWGQDLRYLQSWLDAHPEARPFYLTYFGGFNPADVDIDFDGTVPDVRTAEDLRGLSPGWYAVSVNFVQGYPHTAFETNSAKRYYGQEVLSGFRELSPADCVGASMWIYKISTTNSPKK